MAHLARAYPSFHRINPLTPRSDQYVNSPYIFNTVSNRWVTRMKKILLSTWDMVLICNTKFLGLADREMYGIN